MTVFSDATLTTDQKIESLAHGIDLAYYLLCATLVFFMQVGFAMLEVGLVSSKNIKNIILKSTLDISIAALFFGSIGFAVAFGGDGKFAGGEEYFAGDCLDKDKGCGGAGYETWFFQVAFAAAAATIVSGAVAERTTIICYVLYAIVLTTFVYPVVVHWQWGGGFTGCDHTKDDDCVGAVDYAGSGVVHMTGGLAAIIGAAIIGPRRGRFEGGICRSTTNDMPSYSIVFTTLGTLILWYGWYGFNVGSSLGIVWVGEQRELDIAAQAAGSHSVAGSEAGLVMVNTTVGPAAGAFCTLICCAIASVLKGDGLKFFLEPVLNGILAGLVSITAGCADIRPWAAAVMGAIGGIVYLASSNLLKRLKIDDVADAGPVHFFCGIWGVIGLGLFADDKGTGLAKTKGLFYGDGDLLGRQFILVLAIIAWVGSTMTILFGVLRILGLARVARDVEEMGLDRSEHGTKDPESSL